MLFAFLGIVLWNIESVIGVHAASKIIDFTNFAHIMDFIGLVFIIGIVLNAFLLIVKQRVLTIWVWVVMMAIFDLSLIYAAPSFNRHTIFPIVEAVKDDITPNTIVFNLGGYNQDLPIYLNRNIYLAYDWDLVDLDTQDNWASDFVRGDSMAKHDSDYMLDYDQFEQSWRDYSTGYHGKSFRKIVVFSSKREYAKWESVLEPKPYLLAEDFESVVFSNQPYKK